MSRILVFWLALGAALPAADSIPINMFELPNGLKIIFCPQNNVEATAVCLYYLNGSRNDPPDMRGVSYFFQDLLFLGTANLEPLDHYFFVTQKGGQIGAQVGVDNTFFYQVVPARDLAIALRYESERLRSLRLENGAIDAEKRQVLARIARLEGDVVARARQWVMQTILAGSVYEMPVVGDPEKVRHFPGERVRDFYKVYQNLSNLILVVCGRFSVNDLRNEVNNLFQDMPGGYRSQSSFVAAPIPARPSVYRNWGIEGLARPMVLYGFPAPARLSVDYFYFEFLRAYLGGEKNSHLDVVFNQLNRLNIDVQVSLSDYFENNALLVELSAPDRQSLERAKLLFGQVLQNLQTLPISGDDRSMVKSSLELEFLKQMRRPEVLAKRAAEYYHMFGGLDFFPAYLNRVRKIDAQEIMNIGRKYLQRNSQVVLNVYGKK